MRPPESFVMQPVRSLQTMLRVIANDDPRYPNVIPDGIYGAQTRSAVAAFQRNNALPITGIADNPTWEQIVRIYRPALIRTTPAEPIRVSLDSGQVLRRDEESPYLYLAQSMLTVVSQVFTSIPTPAINGILDESTAASLSAFQQLSALPITGELDKITWKYLSLLFSLAAQHKIRLES